MNCLFTQGYSFTTDGTYNLGTMGTSKKGFYCYLFNNWSQVIYLLGSLLTGADAVAIPPGVLKKEIIVFNK